MKTSCEIQSVKEFVEYKIAYLKNQYDLISNSLKKNKSHHLILTELKIKRLNEIR